MIMLDPTEVNTRLAMLRALQLSYSPKGRSWNYLEGIILGMEVAIDREEFRIGMIQAAAQDLE